MNRRTLKVQLIHNQGDSLRLTVGCGGIIDWRLSVGRLPRNPIEFETAGACVTNISVNTYSQLPLSPAVKATVTERMSPGLCSQPLTIVRIGYFWDILFHLDHTMTAISSHLWSRYLWYQIVMERAATQGLVRSVVVKWWYRKPSLKKSDPVHHDLALIGILNWRVPGYGSSRYDKPGNHRRNHGVELVGIEIEIVGDTLPNSVTISISLITRSLRPKPSRTIYASIASQLRPIHATRAFVLRYGM